jgi:hypothetical protein
MAELLKRKTQKYSIVLIDEIETSIHPRVPGFVAFHCSLVTVVRKKR